MSHDIDPVFLCDDNIELKKKPINESQDEKSQSE